jgi:catalase
MLWHLFLVHDDYGARVGKALKLGADDVKNLQPLQGQVLTEEDKRRLQNLGRNGDRIDPGVWGTWTSSVTDHRATADEVLNNKLPTGKSGSKEGKAMKDPARKAS